MSRRATEFQTIRSEGGLLPPDLLRRILDPKEQLNGTRPEDYGLPQGERLNEVITQSWARLRKHWAEFRTAAANLPAGEAGTGLTNDKWGLPLLRELGFGLLPTSAGPEVGGRVYAINRLFGPVPIHLIGCGLSLDHRAAGVRGAALSNPHGLVQEFLNRSVAHMWGIVSNGSLFRILRDNEALSRQSFLEFDLEAMFDGELYSDFVLLWLIAHATRFAPREGDKPDACWLEVWTKIANEQGTRALHDLRGGVEKALQILGEGFTAHPKNKTLRNTLRTGQASLADFHAQLLRVVYRFIFLFVAEDRTLDGQSLLHPRDGSEAARIARELYATNYSTARLRDLASNIKGSRHGDLWLQFQVIVGALSGDPNFAAAREHLTLPALGSFLWDPGSTSALNDTELTNHDFLEALRHLAFTRPDKVLRPVDFKNLGAEELGGVYETLLGLTPQISADGARFTFAEFAGNERKTSGSYYTPDSLVQCLLDSALDPVVEEALKGKTGPIAEKAILALKICDPAVGSGHFLVRAAHRLARHLARVRAIAQGESEPSPLLYQHALRDVIGHCLYGVDINPMAAELCRVSLWLEALEPGKPLSFLDHHIRVGDSLLGATPGLIAAGIPDEAFDPIEGDDKKACAVLKKRNKTERAGLGPLFSQLDAEIQASLQQAAAALEELPDDRPEEIRAKEVAFRRHEVTEEYRNKKQLADAWCAAFVVKKYFREPGRETTASGITQAKLNDLAGGRPLPLELASEVERLSRQYQFFHWHLAFPEVFRVPRSSEALDRTQVDWNGGFDVVLGNPPWVRQEVLKSVKSLLSAFESFKGTADLSVFFLDLATLIVRLRGRVGLLTPNKWFVADYGSRLRTVLRERVTFCLVIDFGHSKTLFPDADTFPAAVIFERVQVPAGDSTPLTYLHASDSDRKQMTVLALLAESSIVVQHQQLRQDRYDFADTAVADLIKRMMESGIKLGKYVGRPLFRGILTGFNEAFVVDQALRDALIAEDQSSVEIIHPWLSGREVARWLPRWQGQYVIFTRRGTDIDQYPAVKNHLLRWKPRLTPKLRSSENEEEKFGRKPGAYKWYEIQDNVAFYGALDPPKIIFQEIAYHSQFALDDSGTYCNKTVHVIPTDDYFLLAIMNSQVAWWLMNRTLPHMKDGALLLQGSLIARFPIPETSQSLKDEIVSRAKCLRNAVDTESHIQLVEREVELNNLIVQAFGLDEADRATISASPCARDPIQVLTDSPNVDLYGLDK